VYFGAVFNNVKQILITKNKLGTYPSDKYKEITIHIPVPKKEDVLWGVANEKFVNKIDHLDGLINNFNVLDVDFTKFDNKDDYIRDCMSRAIDYCFINGIKMKGVELKLSKAQS
jgi:hypothetical protein